MNNEEKYEAFKKAEKAYMPYRPYDDIVLYAYDCYGAGEIYSQGKKEKVVFIYYRHPGTCLDEKITPFTIDELDEWFVSEEEYYKDKRKKEEEKGNQLVNEIAVQYFSYDRETGDEYLAGVPYIFWTKKDVQVNDILVTSSFSKVQVIRVRKRKLKAIRDDHPCIYIKEI